MPNIILLTVILSVLSLLSGCAATNLNAHAVHEKSLRTAGKTTTQASDKTTSVTLQGNEVEQLLHNFGAHYSKSDVIALEAAIDQQILFLSRSRKTWFTSALDRGQKYFPHFIPALQRQRLPETLVYLPLIESAYQTKAHSHAGAKGLWQFIRPTARRYGLTVNRKQDQRLDMYRASDAAARYLADIKQQFDGDMLLALAGYNAGENRIRRLTRIHGASYAAIRPALPRETQYYVPRLLATILIAQNPKRYGIKPPRTGLPQVVLKHAVSIARLSQVSGVSSARLYDLNNELRGLSKTPRVPYFPLRLPVSLNNRHIAQLNTQLNAHTGAYNIARLSQPASKPVSKPAKLAKPAVAKSKPAKRYANNEVKQKPNKRFTIPAGKYIHYKVQPGNTLQHLAQWFDTPQQKILTWNPTLKRAAHLRDGSIIKIYGLDRDWKKTQHKVKRGESYWLISKRFDVPVSRIVAWNGIASRSLQQGDTIVIYHRRAAG